MMTASVAFSFAALVPGLLVIGVDSPAAAAAAAAADRSVLCSIARSLAAAWARSEAAAWAWSLVAVWARSLADVWGYASADAWGCGSAAAAHGGAARLKLHSKLLRGGSATAQNRLKNPMRRRSIPQADGP